MINQDAIVSTVVATLNGAAEWLGRGEDILLREAAENIRMANLDTLACCPFCMEVTCDDDCPLRPVRLALGWGTS